MTQRSGLSHTQTETGAHTGRSNHREIGSNTRSCATHHTCPTASLFPAPRAAGPSQVHRSWATTTHHSSFTSPPARELCSSKGRLQGRILTPQIPAHQRCVVAARMPSHPGLAVAACAPCPHTPTAHSTHSTPTHRTRTHAPCSPLPSALSSGAAPCLFPSCSEFAHPILISLQRLAR